MSSAHRYLDVLDRVAEAHANAKSAQSAKSGPRTKAEAAQNSQNAQNSHTQGSASKWEACDQSTKGPLLASLLTMRPNCGPPSVA